MAKKAEAGELKFDPELLAQAAMNIAKHIEAKALRESDFGLLHALAQEKRATEDPVDAFVATRIEHLIGRLRQR